VTFIRSKGKPSRESLIECAKECIELANEGYGAQPSPASRQLIVDLVTALLEFDEECERLRKGHEILNAALSNSQDTEVELRQELGERHTEIKRLRDMLATKEDLLQRCGAGHIWRTGYGPGCPFCKDIGLARAERDALRREIDEAPVVYAVQLRSERMSGQLPRNWDTRIGPAPALATHRARVVRIEEIPREKTTNG